MDLKLEIILFSKLLGMRFYNNLDAKYKIKKCYFNSTLNLIQR